MDASHKALGCILTLGEKINSNFIYFTAKSWSAENWFRFDLFFFVNKEKEN